MTKDERRTHKQTTRLLWASPWLVCLLTGCATASWDWLPWKRSDSASSSAKADASAPKDSLVMRGTGLERDRVVDSAMENELEGAKRQFQNKEYRKAETTFHRLANTKKAPVNILDEALYYEAECQRLQENLRDAEGTFRKYIHEFRINGQYVEQANRRQFDIANYWLDDTRAQMQAYEEKRDGKRWFIMPNSYFHVGKDKPFLDMEGHALEVLSEVGLNDIRGTIRTVDGGPSVGERALFYLATVKFYRRDYHEADFYYTQIYENHPNSPLAPKAIKQAIICKQVMNGGSDYDTRGVEEARKLIDRYQGAYPEWNKDRDWLTRQLGSIHLQQADRDLKVAEFYRRTGHPGSAYFYYELVRRRYPNTEAAKLADEHMRDLRGIAEREQGFASNKTPVTRDSPNAFMPIPTTTKPGPQANVTGAFVPPPPPPTPATGTGTAIPGPAPTGNDFPPPTGAPSGSVLAPPPAVNTGVPTIAPPISPAPVSAPPVSLQPPAPIPIAPSTTPSAAPYQQPRLMAPTGGI